MLAGCGSGGGLKWSDENPVWSPDGRRVAFDSNRADPKRPLNAVYVMNADGSAAFRELANPRPPEVAAAVDPEHGRHNVRAKLEQLSNHPRPEIQLGALRELAKLEPESSASGATYVSFLFTDDDTGDFNCPQCGHEFRPSSKSQLRESIDRNSAEHPDAAYMNFDELRATAESNLSREVTPQVDGLPN